MEPVLFLKERFYLLFLFFVFLLENCNKMTTVIINEKTKKGQIILDLIREMGAGKIIDETKSKNHILNDTTLQAIEEVQKGKTIKCTSFEDYLNKVK